MFFYLVFITSCFFTSTACQTSPLRSLSPNSRQNYYGKLIGNSNGQKYRASFSDERPYLYGQGSRPKNYNKVHQVSRKSNQGRHYKELQRSHSYQNNYCSAQYQQLNPFYTPGYQNHVPSYPSDYKYQKSFPVWSPHQDGFYQQYEIFYPYHDYKSLYTSEYMFQDPYISEYQYHGLPYPSDYQIQWHNPVSFPYQEEYYWQSHDVFPSQPFYTIEYQFQDPYVPKYKYHGNLYPSDHQNQWHYSTSSPHQKEFCQWYKGFYPRQDYGTLYTSAYEYQDPYTLEYQYHGLPYPSDYQNRWYYPASSSNYYQAS